MKIAIIHDYLNQYGGGERVVEVLHEIYPEAPVFTSIFDKAKMPESFAKMNIQSSFLQKIPGAGKYAKFLLPLYPCAFKKFKLENYDVILSSSSSFAKGIRKKDALHICYCYTPTRFLWRYKEYVEKENFSKAVLLVLPFLIALLKRGDLKAAAGVDRFIAISQAVARRIKDVYHRESVIIYPPVNTGYYSVSGSEGSYYLVVSRLRGYKRIDLAVAAFTSLKLPLVIAGSGDMESELRKKAGPNIKFAGRLSDAELKELYKNCKAVIFPGEEDFGIVPLEAQAAGKPVIAFKSGGALDTIIDGKTGVFFETQTVSSLSEAVSKLESITFNSEEIRKNALRFDKGIFKIKLKEYIEKSYTEYLKEKSKTKNIDKTSA